ncbi:MFS general substrate transporter [Martensiomyces pterosporus]|nr:MFS general substrate transporter [Martensiomyces pterosporus]
MLSIKEIRELARQRTTYIILIIASYGLLYGLDTAAVATSVPGLKMRLALSALQLEYLGASTSLGAIFGLLIIIGGGSKWSRRATLLVASVVYIAGFVLVGVATDYTTSIVGRSAIGVAHGISTMIAPVFVGELSPKEHRGLFITFNVVSINMGMLLGVSVSWVLSLASDSRCWVFIINAAFSLCLLMLLLLFVPNSPRDLICRGRIDEAKAVIHKLNRPNELPEKAVDEQVESLTSAIVGEGSSGFRDLLAVGNIRPLAVACMLQVAKQSSGFTALQYFSAYIFRTIGFAEGHSSRLPMVTLAVFQTLSVAASLGIIDNLGRRRVLLISTIAMTLGLIALGGSFVAITGFELITREDCSEYARCGACLLDTACGWSPQSGLCVARNSTLPSRQLLVESCQMRTVRDYAGSWLAAVSVIFSLGSFSLGLGNIPWVIQSEIFSQALRSRAGAIGSIFNWLASYAWTVSFLQLAFRISLPWIFWLYAIILAGLVGSVYWAIPETAGRALEDISAGNNTPTPESATVHSV